MIYIHFILVFVFYISIDDSVFNYLLIAMFDWIASFADYITGTLLHIS